MAITTSKLISFAGFAAVAAGLLIILMQIIHPNEDVGTVTTVEWGAVCMLTAGYGMAIGLVLGVTTIRHGDVNGHRAWMIRAYALAFGAATQVVTIGAGYAIFGETELVNVLMHGAGWAANLVVAERAIRRRPTRRNAPARAAVGIS
jgi:hypothetical protein